jgi:hypothetical protein
MTEFSTVDVIIYTCTLYIARNQVQCSCHFPNTSLVKTWYKPTMLNLKMLHLSFRSSRKQVLLKLCGHATFVKGEYVLNDSKIQHVLELFGYFPLKFFIFVFVRSNLIRGNYNLLRVLTRIGRILVFYSLRCTWIVWRSWLFQFPPCQIQQSFHP